MSVSQTYVPVLRWKAAEIEALQYLSPLVKQHVMPIIEVCPSMFVKKVVVDKRIVKEVMPVDILKDRLFGIKRAFNKNTFYLDLGDIDGHKQVYSSALLWSVVLKHANVIPLPFIPIVSLSRKGDVDIDLIANVAKRQGRGIGVRVPLADVFSDDFLNAINRFFYTSNHIPSNSDLIIDFKSIDETIIPYNSIISQIPYFKDWRSITFLGGSFPRDLSELKANETYSLDRLEWVKWEKEYDNTSMPNVRFGDYTIQYPHYIEPPDFPSVSASIRYTSRSSWLVFRGEALNKKNGMGNDQYPAEAALLVSRSDYAGEDFSKGDEIIKNKAIDSSNPGNPSTWLMVGINHHISFVVSELNPHIDIRNTQKKKTKISQLALAFENEPSLQ